MSADSDRLIRLGEVCGVYGVRGWVKVHSYTDPRSNLLGFRDWLLERAETRRQIRVEGARESGRNLLAKLEGIDDRDAALELIGTAILVPRSELPPCLPGEYYWDDLVGLAVENRSGDALGRVSRLVATGANDVLVLEPGDHMIPFALGEIVKDVDIAAGRIVVDWDRSYWD